MNAPQGSRLLRSSAVLAAAGACLALLFTLDGSRAVGASARTEAVACTLVSTGKLESVLGLPQAQVARNFEGTTPASPGRDTECITGLWDGAPPTSRAAVVRAVKSGHAAQIGMETWAPNDGSPDASKWAKEFAKLVTEFKTGATAFPALFTRAGWPSKPFKPTSLGHPTAGFTFAMQKTFKGVLTAVACWWNPKTQSALCLLDEEAASRPVVKHLDRIAAVAVPKFLG
jgi:hypothetical protein